MLAEQREGRLGMRRHIVREIERMQSIHADQENVFYGRAAVAILGIRGYSERK